MSTQTTTESTYDSDLAAATALMYQFVDPAMADGNGAKWISEALNDSWVNGIQITEWVARAVTDIPAGFRRSAAA